MGKHRILQAGRLLPSLEAKLAAEFDTVLLAEQGELLQSRARDLGVALGPGPRADLRRAIASAPSTVPPGESISSTMF